jgi:hypothetical protein
MRSAHQCRLFFFNFNLKFSTYPKLSTRYEHMFYVLMQNSMFLANNCTKSTIILYFMMILGTKKSPKDKI